MRLTPEHSNRDIKGVTVDDLIIEVPELPELSVEFEAPRRRVSEKLMQDLIKSLPRMGEHNSQSFGKAFRESWRINLESTDVHSDC